MTIPTNDAEDGFDEDLIAALNSRHLNGYHYRNGDVDESDGYGPGQGRARLESRMSICLPSKGLANAPGDNNCFLNTSVQLLWHVNVFRRSFRLLNGHACVKNACIFCALKKIFHQLEDSDVSVLGANDLRQAMANAFMDERQFQLGRMCDAAECLETILMRLHNHTAWQEQEDSCSALHCIPHQKFACQVVEQTSCNCQATSEPKSFHQFVFYISASELVENAHMNRKHPLTFGKLLRSCTQQEEKRSCPDEKRCLYKQGENVTSVQTTLLNQPDVFTIGIIWDSDSQSAQQISNVMNCIEESFFMVDLFDNIPNEKYKHMEMKLAGLVTFYGRHYTSFFYNIREKQWTYFDDAQVTKIGSSWKKVKQRCENTRFQPLLIVFNNGSGSLVPVDNAPKVTTEVSKDIFLAAKPPTRVPSQRTKNHKSHRKKKHRSSSNSPLHSPNKTNPHLYSQGRASPRNSTGSQSPSSPQRDDFMKQHNTSSSQYPKSPKKGDMTTTTLEKTKHKSSAEELNLIAAAPFSRPPKALMRESASDTSIADKSRNGHMGQELDHSTSHRKRTGSMKKKVGNVIKAIKPFKGSKSESSTPTGERNDFLMPVDGLEVDRAFADVGYTSPYNKRSNKTTTNDKSPTTLRKHENTDASNVRKKENQRSPVSSRKSNHDELKNGRRSPNPQKRNARLDQDSTHDNVSQLKNLENHRNILQTNMKRTSSIDQRKPVVSNERFPDFVDSTGDNREVSREKENGFHDSRYLTPSPDESSTIDLIYDEFQGRLSKGDKYLNNADYYEKKGDILYALQLCTYATSVFREASKTKGISKDLLQYVDNRRSESYERSLRIQRQLDEFLHNEYSTDDSQYTEDFSQPPSYHGRTGSTSGYSSMSDVTVKSENINGNAREMYDNNKRRVVRPSYDAGDHMTLMHHTDSRQQASGRIQRDQGYHLDQQQQSYSSAEYMRRKSQELLEHNNRYRRGSGPNLTSFGARSPVNAHSADSTIFQSDENLRHSNFHTDQNNPYTTCQTDQSSRHTNFPTHQNSPQPTIKVTDETNSEYENLLKIAPLSEPLHRDKSVNSSKHPEVLYRGPCQSDDYRKTFLINPSPDASPELHENVNEKYLSDITTTDNERFQIDNISTLCNNGTDDQSNTIYDNNDGQLNRKNNNSKGCSPFNINGSEKRDNNQCKNSLVKTAGAFQHSLDEHLRKNDEKLSDVKLQMLQSNISDSSYVGTSQRPSHANASNKHSEKSQTLARGFDSSNASKTLRPNTLGIKTTASVITATAKVSTLPGIRRSASMSNSLIRSADGVNYKTIYDEKNITEIQQKTSEKHVEETNLPSHPIKFEGSSENGDDDKQFVARDTINNQEKVIVSSNKNYNDGKKSRCIISTETIYNREPANESIMALNKNVTVENVNFKNIYEKESPVYKKNFKKESDDVNTVNTIKYTKESLSNKEAINTDADIPLTAELDFRRLPPLPSPDQIKTIYDENPSKTESKEETTQDHSSRPSSAKSLIARFNSIDQEQAKTIKPSTLKQKDLTEKLKNNSTKISKSLTLPHKSDDEMNTLQRLNKEGKTIYRCPNCKWRHVQTVGEYCKQCRDDYLDTLKRKVNNSTGETGKSEIKKINNHNASSAGTNQNGYNNASVESGKFGTNRGGDSNENVGSRNLNAQQNERHVINNSEKNNTRTNANTDMNTETQHYTVHRETSENRHTNTAISADSHPNAHNNIKNEISKQKTSDSSGKHTLKPNKKPLSTETINRTSKVANSNEVNYAETKSKDAGKTQNKSGFIERMSESNMSENMNISTLEKVKKEVKKKIKCAQCGWRQVEKDGQFCSDCQSEYV